MQQLHVLAGDLSDIVGEACDVSSKPGKARDVPAADWIAHPYHDNRNGRRRSLGSLNGGSTRHDDVNFHFHQFSREAGKPLVISFCPAVLDDYVLALYVA